MSENSLDWRNLVLRWSHYSTRIVYTFKHEDRKFNLKTYTECRVLHRKLSATKGEDWSLESECRVECLITQISVY